MAYDWNPNAPKNVGLEHALVGNQTALIDEIVKAYRIRWRAQSAAALDHVLLPAATGSVSPSKHPTDPTQGPWGMIVADLRARSNEGLPGAGVSSISTHDASAVADVTGWLSSTGGAAVVADVQVATGGRYAKSTTKGDLFSIQFNTGAFSLTASQVMRVRVRIWASAPLAAGLLRVQMLVSGVGTFYKDLVVPVGAYGTLTPLVVDFGELWEVSSGVFSWINGQGVRDLASAGTRKVRLTNMTPTGNEIQVSDAQVEVYGQNETRLAVGVARPSPVSPASQPAPPIGDVAWIDFAMLKPDKSAAFTTVNAADYTLIVRQPSDFSSFGDQAGKLAMRRLKGTPKFSLLTMAPASSFDTASTDPTNMPGFGVSVNDDATPVVRFQTGTTDRGESQPYVAHAGGLIWSAGSGGPSNSGQLFAAPASASFPLLMIDVSADYEPDVWLNVKVKIEGSTDVTALAYITPEQVASAPVVGSALARLDHVTVDPGRIVDVHRVTVDFSEWGAVTPLVNATTYRVVLNSGAAVDRPWVVAGSWMAPTSGGAEANTFQGATGYATGMKVADGSGLVAHTNIHGDLMLILATKPAGPSNLAVATAHATMAVGEEADDHCIPLSLPYATLTWATSSLVADFAGYVIERYDALTAEWVRIGYVTTENVLQLADGEGRLNVESSYRVRSERLNDGALSDPTATVTFTPATDECILAFTTNEDLSGWVAYPDVSESTPSRPFSIVDKVTFHDLYGRDTPMAFRQREDGGWAFERTLLVNAEGEPVAPGIDGLARLRALTRAEVSYICVRDGQGGRWYANVILPSADHYLPAERLLATVRVQEVSREPSTPDVSVDPNLLVLVQHRA